MSLYETIMRECGDVTAEAVRLHLGGMRIKIPSTWTPTHILNAAGEAHARSLVEAFAGETLEIPSHRVSKKNRTAAIHDLRQRGYTMNQIARAVGCTESWVRKALRAEREKNQLQLL